MQINSNNSLEKIKDNVRRQIVPYNYKLKKILLIDLMKQNLQKLTLKDCLNISKILLNLKSG